MRMIALALFLLLAAGCTLGPVTECKYVIVRPGQPIQIMQNVKVKGRRIDTNDVAKIDIGGWYAMPKEHFEALKRAAEK